MLHWSNGYMGAGWGVVMMLAVLAFWLLVAYALTRSARTRLSEQLSAEQILAERLARGEIEPDDYRARLAALTPGG